MAELTNDQLHAAVRYEWKVAELLRDAALIERGTYEHSKVIPLAAIPATVASMRAQAERIAAAAAAARVELDERAARVAPFTGYVS